MGFELLEDEVNMHGVSVAKCIAFADNQSSLLTCSENPSGINGWWSYIVAQSYQSLKNCRVNVSLTWSPGRKGIDGNKRADSLTKEAVELGPHDALVAFSSLKRDIEHQNRVSIATAPKNAKTWAFTSVVYEGEFLKELSQFLAKSKLGTTILVPREPPHNDEDSSPLRHQEEVLRD
ncbi:hypothetical protein RUND412_011479 [Rhizina undulata]